MPCTQQPASGPVTPSPHILHPPGSLRCHPLMTDMTLHVAQQHLVHALALTLCILQVLFRAVTRGWIGCCMHHSTAGSYAAVVCLPDAGCDSACGIVHPSHGYAPFDGLSNAAGSLRRCDLVGLAGDKAARPMLLTTVPQQGPLEMIRNAAASSGACLCAVMSPCVPVSARLVMLSRKCRAHAMHA